MAEAGLNHPCLQDRLLPPVLWQRGFGFLELVFKQADAVQQEQRKRQCVGVQLESVA
jgi:hypothetical protein